MIERVCPECGSNEISMEQNPQDKDNPKYFCTKCGYAGNYFPQVEENTESIFEDKEEIKEEPKEIKTEKKAPKVKKKISSLKIIGILILLTGLVFGGLVLRDKAYWAEDFNNAIILFSSISVVGLLITIFSK